MLSSSQLQQDIMAGTQLLLSLQLGSYEIRIREFHISYSCKPVANMLARKAEGGNATVTLCHTRTPNLADFTRQADILVVASGHPKTVTGDMVKPGATVIDVGVNRVPDATAAKGYRLVGDVDFESAKEVAGLITPVPGGVGPMTITMLLYNTVQSAKCRAQAVDK